MESNGKVAIVFFPHATTFDNEAGISTGQAEVSVSPLGKEQIKNLRRETEKEKFDAVFSSDLTRAVETAEGAFGQTNKIIIDSRLREIDIGNLTGQKDSNTEPLATKYIDTPFPNGESYKDVESRVKNFLNDLAINYPDKKVAIVGHQATQFALDVILKKLAWLEAIENDWRKTKAFQYGWEYTLLK